MRVHGGVHTSRDRFSHHGHARGDDHDICEHHDDNGPGDDHDGSDDDHTASVDHDHDHEHLDHDDHDHDDHEHLDHDDRGTAGDDHHIAAATRWRGRVDPGDPPAVEHPGTTAP